ncbi:MAG: FMN-binding protein [Candidatus Eisenbacteria sp.]|nr:FMN-binding protein [Candidatus Eisenbacteria bacterium]
MAEAPKSRNFIGQAWLVILLALLYGGALATVHTALSARIAENKRNETYSVIPILVEGADQSMTAEVSVEGQNGKELTVYRVLDSGGHHRGWVLPAAGQGFADQIEILIGLDAEVSTIAGLYVLGQKETPGLGDYITGEGFRNRFRGKPTDRPLVVVKSDPKANNEILALTGATISSESVSGIVNRALANLKGPIRQLAPGGGEEQDEASSPADRQGETGP